METPSSSLRPAGSGGAVEIDGEMVGGLVVHIEEGAQSRVDIGLSDCHGSIEIPLGYRRALMETQKPIIVHFAGRSRRIVVESIDQNTGVANVEGYIEQK